MRVLILIFSSFLIVDGTSRVSTTCTAEACLTLHLEEEHFEKASKNCINNGGKLVTMRNDNELQSVKSAFLAAAAEEGEKERVFSSKLWIGLSLQKKRCTDSTEELHGFRWTSEPEDSQYSYWKKKPLRTCTEKRCVSISLADDLRWTDGSCRDRAFYMCRFLSKGMCRPIVLEERSEVKYNLPFLSEPLTLNERLVMIPHGTWAEVQCVGSEIPIISFCSNQDGPFDWTNSERFCAPDKRSCELKNGGCEHLCSETAGGGVRCECREGYHLIDDKVSCAAKDSCENSPCEFKCVPTATGYSCACAEGFRLAGDNVSCDDINECREGICGEHKCHNTPGSYHCDCHSGFRLVAGKCEDVDECTESRCAQGCLNSQGSFSCYCHTGFILLSDDRGICIDVDECILGKPCEDICTNTFGSFECSCRGNFTLAYNGISCVPKPTERPQISPENRESIITNLTRLPDGFGLTTVNPVSLNKTNTKTDSIKSRTFLGISWIFVCVLGSAVPLLVLIVLTSAFVIYRWRRSRKDTLKNATADNYCWVSSGLDTDQKKSNTNKYRLNNGQMRA